MDLNDSDIKDKSFSLNQNSVKDFLKIPSDFRSPHQLKIISKLLLKIEFFEQYKNDPILINLAKEVFYKEFTENITIYHQGDPGDAFYAVYSGAIKICITIPSDIENSNNMV